MSSGENGKARRVVLMALLCAGCAAAPVIALRETPRGEPSAPERPVAVVGDNLAAIGPAVATTASEPPAPDPPAPLPPETPRRSSPALNRDELLRRMTVG